MLSISKLSANPLLRESLSRKPAQVLLRYYKPFLAGFFCAAAAFAGHAQPLVLGLVWALQGADAEAAAIGAFLGCLGFLREEQLYLWIFFGFVLSRLRQRARHCVPWLREALGAAIVSATGLAFQLLGDDTTVSVYLLRVALGAMAPGFFIPLLSAFPRSLAQVKLELAAHTLEQSSRVIADLPEAPIDEEALILRARERACGSCPAARFCRDRDRTLPEAILRKPLVGSSILCWQCREPGRLLLELRRSQEQLRLLKADRQKCGQYRQAVGQQYAFLAKYLRHFSDDLTKAGEIPTKSYRFETAVRSNRTLLSGDSCRRFGSYILLCDGMGTGPGAARDARFAADLLQRLLTCGYPAQAALQSFNALCCLSLGAGAVTVDLCKVEDGGTVRLYKWGAGRSYVLRSGRLRPAGEVTAPPGMGVTESCRQATVRLRKGEVLILCSDGVKFPPGEVFPAPTAAVDLKALARQLMSRRIPSPDDATLALLRLTEG